MRTVLTAISLSLTLIAGSALAEPLGGDIEAFATNFNQSSKKLKLDTKFSKSDCYNSSSKRICTYMHSSALGIMAESAENSKELNQLLMLYGGKNSKGFEILEAIVILTAMYSPKASPDERGVLVKEILNIVENSETRDLTLHGITYRVSYEKGSAVMILLKKGD